MTQTRRISRKNTIRLEEEKIKTKTSNMMFPIMPGRTLLTHLFSLIIVISLILSTYHSATATPINANRPGSFDDDSNSIDRDNPSSYPSLLLLVTPEIDKNLAIDLPWTALMEADARRPPSSPLRLQGQESQQAEEKDEEGDQEQNQGQQVVSSGGNADNNNNSNSNSNSEDAVDVSDTSKRRLISKAVFETPQQYVQTARLIGRSEFMDMGGSSILCQFEAGGDGVGPFFGFGNEVYPDVLVDGIECMAWMSDDELDMTDDEDLTDTLSEFDLDDDDDVEEVAERYPFTLDDFFDGDDDDGGGDEDEDEIEIEDDEDEEEEYQFPDDPPSSDGLPNVVNIAENSELMPEDLSDSSQRDVWSPWGGYQYPAGSRNVDANTRASVWSQWGSDDDASSSLAEDDSEMEISDVGGGSEDSSNVEDFFGEDFLDSEEDADGTPSLDTEDEDTEPDY